MPLKLNSSGGGSVTLDVPSTASTFTATVPANTGTLVTTGSTAAVTQGMLASGVAGNGPAFRATLSANQSVSANTKTKIALNTETFDTANCYDPTTNYRFTPNVAGYYQVNGVGAFTGTSTSALVSELRKNNTAIAISFLFSGNGNIYVGDLVYMNGSTDYIEFFGQVNCSSGATFTTECSFSASLVRAA